MHASCIRGVATVLVAAILFPTSASLAAVHAKDRKAALVKIRAAKFAFFDDQTRADAIGQKTFEELKKWGKFQFVLDRTKADLIILLSADPYKGGYVIFSGGQTGTMGAEGNIEEDRVPNFSRAAPVRYAYLTVIDPKTGEELWSASHHWGGLLTGFSSAGVRLVTKLRKETKG